MNNKKMPYWVFKRVWLKEENGKLPCFYAKNFTLRGDSVVFFFNGFQSGDRKYADLFHSGETVIGTKTDYSNQEWAILKQKIQAA